MYSFAVRLLGKFIRRTYELPIGCKLSHYPLSGSGLLAHYPLSPLTLSLRAHDPRHTAHADNLYVKPVRRLSIFSLALALVLAAGASARVAGSDAGSLEVQHGSGIVVVTMARGALIGHFAAGRITVTSRRGAVDVTVFGAEETVQVNDSTTVYRGRDVRFKVSGQGWRVGIQALGLDASLVGRGVATLRGVGMMSVDGAAFQPWPADFRSVPLGGTPPTAEGSGTIRGG